MEVKESRINNIDLVDRISALPEFVLGHILSFLPTSKAVSTSILSKRWKFAWVAVHSLDFCYPIEEDDEDDEDVKEEDIMEFVGFVNRVLLLNGVGSLNKLSLTCIPESFSPQFISWINTAITRNVHHLYLCIGDNDMPACLFSCDSLRSLFVCGFFSFRDTTTVCLPRLESLSLHTVSFESEEASENLISRCPILQHLSLTIICNADDDLTCIISSASLKHLVIYFEETQARSKLKLKASSLEHLRICNYPSEIFVEKSLTSLVEADLHIQFGAHDFPNNSIVEVVRVFDCAKFLSLSPDVMQALSCATINLSTNFKRLVQLKSRICCSSLHDFIQSSNNLEVLIINQDEPCTHNRHDHSRWTTLLEVPRCLSTSLKEIYFCGYNGSEDEDDMICYMLKYGSVREVMNISCYDKGDGEKLKLLKEIHEFPRKSPVCKVQFL